MSDRLFEVGDRVFNTSNKQRKVIGIVTRVISDQTCRVLWSDGEGYAYEGNIWRDGSTPWHAPEGGRIVRVKLSVRLPADARGF